MRNFYVFLWNFGEFANNNKRTNMAYFGPVSGGRIACIHDFAMKYMTADWAVTGRILKLFI